MLKHYYIGLLLGFLFQLTFTSDVNARICSSTGSGSWSSAATWNCGGIPACGDTIYVAHLVEITSNITLDAPGCTTPTFIVIKSGGDLNFDSGKKMSLACGSGVTIEAGGQLTSDGGGASENLKICSVVVWQGSWDADLDGPTVLGSGLPIELMYFAASHEGNHVDVMWTTATETNNDHFTIERSENGIDYDYITLVDGAGNSNSIINYRFEDFSPLTGNSYYRLKQTDFDGNYSYSHSVTVKSQTIFSGDIHVYPNPAEDKVNLSLIGFEDESIAFIIYDLSGRLIFEKNIISNSREFTTSIGLSQEMEAGSYLVSVRHKEGNFSQLLVIR